MSVEQIQTAVKQVIDHYTTNPEQAISADSAATATVEAGLRCRATGPNGAELVTDMPRGIGGGGSAPTPGWFMRAALANCDATMIALRAAELGIELTTLEVTVDSTSDNRGLLEMDNEIAAGPLAVRVRVKIGAESVTEAQLRDLIIWTERHSPVGDAIGRAVPYNVAIEFV